MIDAGTFSIRMMFAENPDLFRNSLIESFPCIFRPYTKTLMIQQEPTAEMIQQEPSAEMIQEPSAEIQEPPAEMQAAEGAAQLAASDPLSQASTACASPRRSQASTTPLGLPDADIDEDNLDVDDDSLQNLGHACVVVSDDEMRVRVASAMRGLDRLQRMNIDPHELPTIHALFVRWTISQWALEGPSCTRIPAMQQQAPADLGHSDTKHSLVPGHCSGKNTHQVSHRKRARGDIDSCVVEVASLGCIRGPGCTNARLTGTPFFW